MRIANAIQSTSDDVLQVEEGSLYPALQRMLVKGWVKACWGTTAGKRRARYYALKAQAGKQLELERSQFERVIVAINRVIQMAGREQEQACVCWANWADDFGY